MRARRMKACDLRSLAGEPWVDTTRRAFVRDGKAYIPVKEGEPWDLELPDRKPYRGRGYHRLGNLVLLHGPRPTQGEMDEILAWTRPEGILWIRGIGGTERSPRVEVLAGSPGEVRHREFGCTFVFDPTRVMFARGNLSERHRMGELVREKGAPERVADLFAGIGYFTIPVARAGASVHAMEISATAHGYLVRNVRENGVADRVIAECGDCRDLLRGVYDRLILGHFDSPEVLPDALAHAQKGSVLHVHTLRDETHRLSTLAGDAGFTAAITTRRVKSYAPHTWHWVQDVVLG